MRYRPPASSSLLIPVAAGPWGSRRRRGELGDAHHTPPASGRRDPPPVPRRPGSAFAPARALMRLGVVAEELPGAGRAIAVDEVLSDIAQLAVLPLRRL